MKDKIMFVITVAVLLWIVIWALISLGICSYHIEQNKEYNADGFSLRTYVWHNGEIVASGYKTGVSFEKIDSVKAAEENWAKSVISKLK